MNMFLGDVKLLLFRKPNARSDEMAVMPSAKLYVPPADELFNTPAPVVPAAAVVSVVPLTHVVALDTLKPLGKVAVALVPIPSKFWVTGVPIVLIVTCALAVGCKRATKEHEIKTAF
ncbi:MAG: hypothetical protein ACK4E8_08570 [Lacibacter sp.]